VVPTVSGPRLRTAFGMADAMRLHPRVISRGFRRSERR
jgi:hypothetical protein